MNIKENFEVNEIRYLEETNKSGYKQVYIKYSYNEDGKTKNDIATRRCHTTMEDAIFFLNNTKYVCDVETLQIKSKQRLDNYNSSEPNNVNLSNVNLNANTPNFNNLGSNSNNMGNNSGSNINNIGGEGNEEKGEENNQIPNEGNGEGNNGAGNDSAEESEENNQFFSNGENNEESDEEGNEEVKGEEISAEPGEVVHPEYNVIKECISNDIPVFLTGPAGSGKNFTIKKIAEELELDFYFTNSVQQEYKITGFIDAGGTFHETEFYKAFKDGGLFFLDEMDASIPEVLVLLNAAIANRYFEFPNGRIDAHENFRVVAAGNTIGKGADEMYTGRTILDGATLDRFVNVKFDYDEKIELMLANNDKVLVGFIHELRENCAKYDIQATFSYRCIEHIVKLKKVLPIEKILEIAVFKSMTLDDMKMFKFEKRNKYTRAVNALISSAQGEMNIDNGNFDNYQWNEISF